MHLQQRVLSVKNSQTSNVAFQFVVPAMFCRRRHWAVSRSLHIRLVVVLVHVLLANCRGPALQEANKQSTIFDLGNIRAGSRIKKEFSVHNPNMVPVSIEWIRSTCSCTSLSSNDPKVIPAKSSLTLEAEIFPSEKTVGDFSSKLVVKLSGQPEMEIGFRAKLVPGIPTHLAFGDILRGDKREQKFAIAQWPGAPLRVTVGKYDERYLTVNTVDAADVGRATEIKLALTPDVPYGPFLIRVPVNLNDPISPNHAVLVSGNVLERVVIEPKVVSFGVLLPGDSRDRLIHLRSPYLDQLPQTDVVYTGKADLSWKVQEVDEGGKERILSLTLHVPDDAHPGIIRDRVTLGHVFDTGRETVEIEILASI